MSQPPTPARSKRFYKTVTIGDVPDGFRVELDGRSIKTPQRNTLVVPMRSLAVAIAAEWEGQSEEIDLDAMPLTRLAQRAVDSAGHGRERLIDEIMNFSNSDLLCYRATDPDPLVKLQSAEWQPALDWAAQELGAHLEVRTALMIVEQPLAALAALRARVETLSDFELAGLAPATALLGSLVLGLALHCGHIDSQKALSLSLLDELWQVEQWGEDAEAAARRALLARDLHDLEHFLGCFRQDSAA